LVPKPQQQQATYRTKHRDSKDRERVCLFFLWEGLLLYLFAILKEKKIEISPTR
jgi:hypothetical protein